MASEDSAPNSNSPEKFVVRLPKGMRRRIADAARAYHRSMNSEIVARLEHSLDTGAEQYPEPITGDRSGESPTPQEGEGTGSDDESRLIATYRRMSPERRRALLALLD
jgi:hypothetical protein